MPENLRTMGSYIMVLLCGIGYNISLCSAAAALRALGDTITLGDSCLSVILEHCRGSLFVVVLKKQG